MILTLSDLQTKYQHVAPLSFQCSTRVAFENSPHAYSEQISQSGLTGFFFFNFFLLISRFQLSRKGKTWRDSFLVERGYVLLIGILQDMFTSQTLSRGDMRLLVFGWLKKRNVMFSCSFRKPPHKRADGKEMAQEENFLPKYQRVKDLCQKAEYQTSCQQPGQVSNLQELTKTGY